MYLEIVTPETLLYSGEVTSVALPGVNGEFQMLDNHAPIVSLLGQGNIKIYGNITLEEGVQDKFSKGSNNTTLLSINSGIIELKDNKVIVLAD